jgi:hypothetical protein
MLVIDFSKVGLKSPQRASKRQEEASPATVATDSTGAPLISPSTVFETLILAIIDRLEKGGEVLIASQWQAAHDAEEILTLALDCGATERELKALVACYLATHSFNPSPQHRDRPALGSMPWSTESTDRPKAIPARLCSSGYWKRSRRASISRKLSFVGEVFYKW